MRYKVGDVIAPLELVSVDASTVRIPDPGGRSVLLHFSRWAGCPICNVHLAEFRRRASEIERAGIVVVMVFHSPTKDIRELRGDLPFFLIADPEKKLYEAFAVGRSLLFAAYPKAFRALRSEAKMGNKAQRIHGGILGLPADFLIGPAGGLTIAHYGVHADDAMSVSDILGLAKFPRALSGTTSP